MTTLPVLEAPPAAPAPTIEPLLGVYRRPTMEFVRGAGVELFDAEGSAYLDFTSGIGVNALGYADAGIAKAARDALDAGIVHASNLFHTRPARALANALVARSFASSAFFCSSLPPHWSSSNSFPMRLPRAGRSVRSS